MMTQSSAPSDIITRLTDSYAAIAWQLKAQYKCEPGEYGWQIKHRTEHGKLVRVVTRVTITEEPAS